MIFMKIKPWILLLGPLSLFAARWSLPQQGWSVHESITLGIAIWCALWWSTEIIPIPATSLIPLSVLPFLGVLTASETAQAYGDHLILLLLGGFILSRAMEKSGAHRRVALGLVNLLGGNNPKQLVLGFMLASALLSMWISNTATVLMLLPVAMAVLEKMPTNRLAAPLLLGIAYAANIGGIGTPVGTPPNLIFMKIYLQNTGKEMGFLEWMSWGVPVVLLFVPLTAWLLTRNLKAPAVKIPVVGRWQAAEIRVFAVFFVTAVLWVTRTPDWGWAHRLEMTWVKDGQIALIAAISLFVIPDGKKGKLLDWEHANKIPWGVLLLFAGGIALAKAFVKSGLSEKIAQQLAQFHHLPIILMIILISLAVTFLTELTSNTATTTLLMPILAAAGIAAQIDPALVMIPAAMSASCAFMLPVATAPNAIVFGTELIPIQKMMYTGLKLNLIGVLVIGLISYMHLSGDL